MTTTALPRGRTIDVLTKAQSAFATIASGNWNKTFIYSHTLEEKQPFQDDGLLGVARANDRDTVAPSPGLPILQGQIVVPLDWNHIGYWLKWMLGAAVDTGSADPYTHVFTSGAETLDYNSLEVEIKNVGGSPIFQQYMGLIGSKFTLEASRAAGYQKVTVDVVGRSELKAGSTAGGTPATAAAREPVAAAIGQFKLNGSLAAAITKVSATYDNKPTAQNFLNGTAYPSGYDLDDEATFTGSIGLRFLDTTLYDLAVAGGLNSGEILYSASANRSLSLLAANMRLEKSGMPISGPGGIEQSFNFRAEQTNSAAMLVATLKSLVPVY